MCKSCCRLVLAVLFLLTFPAACTTQATVVCVCVDAVCCTQGRQEGVECQGHGVCSLRAPLVVYMRCTVRGAFAPCHATHSYVCVAVWGARRTFVSKKSYTQEWLVLQPVCMYLCALPSLLLAHALASITPICSVRNGPVVATQQNCLLSADTTNCRHPRCLFSCLPYQCVQQARWRRCELWACNCVR